MAEFKIIELPFERSDLEPFMTAHTLSFHYDKHHQAYVAKFNAALKAEGLEDKDVREVFANVSKYSGAIRNNGGGAWNHNFFFEALTKAKENNRAKGPLLAAIEKSFESFEKFKEVFANSGATCFGSGWAWLSLEKDGSLHVFSTANQDNCLMDICDHDCEPLLTMDVWEHAYYLDYQNARPEYIEKFFNLINWDVIEARFEKAVGNL